ncbi:hypothetical protein [uncultured Flavonifractor sp.]|uniref:hypothetical protein n=1 Tax=uncultured Flavonifractor sp. TaxID=1193534 RepID=UPI0026361368|nr:hypothetical protein [uncultured Flavonifractor sp.]
METIYYHLNAARITSGGARKVSGGEGLRCVVLPRQTAPAPAAGTVLDFAACRRALEERAAAQTPPARRTQADPRVEAEPRAEGSASCQARRSLWLAADLCASAAVVFFTALAALGVLLG